jgi:hypothetical protein
MLIAVGSAMRVTPPPWQMVTFSAQGMNKVVVDADWMRFSLVLYFRSQWLG